MVEKLIVPNARHENNPINAGVVEALAVASACLFSSVLENKHRYNLLVTGHRSLLRITS